MIISKWAIHNWVTHIAQYKPTKNLFKNILRQNQVFIFSLYLAVTAKKAIGYRSKISYIFHHEHEKFQNMTQKQM